MRPPILVTGATGQQGGAVARALLDGGHAVRAMTRDPTAPAALALAARGAQVVRGDFHDPASLRSAAQGASAAFLMGTPFEEGTDAEAQQGVAAVDACTDAGVDYLVYTSVGGADQDTGIPHFDSKARVEAHLRERGVRHAVVAPVFFRENLTTPWMTPALAGGRLELSLPSDRSLQTVEVREIGAVAATVLADPDAYAGRRIEIASDESTPADMAAMLSAATGRTIEHAFIPLDAVREQREDVALMYEWFDRVGYNVDLAELQAAFPDVPWRGFDAWAQAQDWSMLEQARA